MSWKLAIFGIAVTSMFRAGDGLGILSISRKPSSDSLKEAGIPGTPLLHICFDENIEETAEYDSVTLEVRQNTIPIVDVTFYEYKDETDSETNCKFFEGDLVDYVGLEILFISVVWNSAGKSVKDDRATITIPDEFVEVGDIMSLKSGTTNSLRLAIAGGNLKKWNICADSDFVEEKHQMCNTKMNVCYVTKVKTDATSYSLCVKATDTSTLLIGAKPEATPVTEKEADPETVLLNYGYEDKLKKELTQANIVITSGTSGLEFVPYKEDGEVYAVCGVDGDICYFKYTESKDAMNILIFNLDDSKSNILPFKDYNIQGEHIGHDIIEVHWEKKDEDESYYEANIVDSAALDIPLQDSIIDCSRTDPNHASTYCFAYFIDMTQLKYLVTVIPAGDANLPETGALVDQKALNKIRTKPVPTTKTQEKKIMGITLLQDYSHAGDVLKVCYKGSENNSNNTRHEAIIIDESGHWIKILHSTNGENLMHCFSPVNLLTSTLKITKASKLSVVIIERELAGYTVLASGQTDMELSALRAIKPEVDNGSKGSTSTLAIVGAAIGGIACLMALVAAAVMFVMKIKRDNDGLQYPLHRTNIEQDSSYIHGLDNPIPTM